MEPALAARLLEGRAPYSEKQMIPIRLRSHSQQGAPHDRPLCVHPNLKLNPRFPFLSVHARYPVRTVRSMCSANRFSAPVHRTDTVLVLRNFPLLTGSATPPSRRAPNDTTGFNIWRDQFGVSRPRLSVCRHEVANQEDEG